MNMNYENILIKLNFSVAKVWWLVAMVTCCLAWSVLRVCTQSPQPSWNSSQILSSLFSKNPWRMNSWPQLCTSWGKSSQSFRNGDFTNWRHENWLVNHTLQHLLSLCMYIHRFMLKVEFWWNLQTSHLLRVWEILHLNEKIILGRGGGIFGEFVGILYCLRIWTCYIFKKLFEYKRFYCHFVVISQKIQLRL